MNTTKLRVWCNEQRFYPEQAKFVWDELARLMCSDLDFNQEGIYQRYFDLVDVIGTHRCGSCELPVYSLERPEHGIRFVLRRASDWKMSVISDRPIKAYLDNLALTKAPTRAQVRYGDDPLRSAFMEGFPSELMFGYHKENRQQFSMALSSDQHVWTAMFLILSDLSIIEPKVHAPPPKGR